MAKYEIRELPVEVIRPANYNPRIALKPGDVEYEQLRRSLDELDIVDPLIWNETTGTLVGGHQRLQVLIDMGRRTVPCWVVHLDPKQEKQANVALNKISGRWDEEKLRGVLEELDAEAVFSAGFDPKELRELYEDGTDPVKEDDFDVAASMAARPEPRTKPGDLLLLGEHRLLCGDATKADDATRLFDGRHADMIFTDPPYNVDYEGSDGQKILNDKMDSRNFYRFLLSAFTVACGHLKPGSGVYICHSDAEGVNFRTAMQNAGILQKQCLVWVKNALVLGRQDYQWQHELILYGWKPGAKHRWYGGRKQTTILHLGDIVTVEQEEDGTFSLCISSGLEAVRINVPAYSITAKTEGSSVWLFDKPKRNAEHPTMKPLLLCGRAIANSSKRGDLVADPFAGSGSTLIASEQLGRRCYSMELDPRYCDVIADRWQHMTGKEVSWICPDP